MLFAGEVGQDASTAVSRRGGIASIRRWSASKPHDVKIDMRVAATQEDLESAYNGHEMVLRSGDDSSWWFEQERVAVFEGREAVEGFQRTGERLTKLRSNVVSPLASGLSEGYIPMMTSLMLLARQVHWDVPLRVTWWTSFRSLRPSPEIIRRPQPEMHLAPLDETASNIASVLRSLREDAKERVVQAMKALVPGLVDIRVQQTGQYLALVFSQAHGRDVRPEFAATEMSDGALRALALIVAAEGLRPPGILVVEEPEVNIHPGAARVVYDVLRRASRYGAVLITTHSPELLDHAKDDHILVCEYRDGTTHVGPLAREQREVIREGLFSTAELMRTEELRRDGAPPRVVSDE